MNKFFCSFAGLFVRTTLNLLSSPCQSLFRTDIILDMRVPYTWLKEFIEFSNPPEDVADRLTMTGLEVEGAESVEGDTIFEVNVTPNRPDCLSILGIARELAAVLKSPLKIPPCEFARRTACF